MFDAKLALVLFLAGIPGMVTAIPRLAKQLVSTISTRLPEGKPIPSTRLLSTVQLAQSIVLVGGLVVLGTIFAPKAGLEAPLFYSIAHGSDLAESLPALLPILGISVGGAFVFIGLYYLVFRKWIDPESIAKMESFRENLGILSRLLYGGVVEELLVRWGLMSILVWLFGLVTPDSAAIWIGIIVAGVVFGLSHLPTNFAAGCRKSVAVVTGTIGLNLWAGVVFGYLFATYGISAAIFAHMVLHLIWHPFDRTYIGK